MHHAESGTQPEANDPAKLALMRLDWWQRNGAGRHMDVEAVDAVHAIPLTTDLTREVEAYLQRRWRCTLVPVDTTAVTADTLRFVEQAAREGWDIEVFGGFAVVDMPAAVVGNFFPGDVAGAVHSLSKRLHGGYRARAAFSADGFTVLVQPSRALVAAFGLARYYHCR